MVTEMSEMTIFTNKEACEFLRISPVTLWRERKRGRISFRRAASKIVYTYDDLLEYLNSNKREAFEHSNTGEV